MRWGFQWGKVASGAAIFLLAGGFTLVCFLATDRLLFTTSFIAGSGFFVMLSGLMGKEGIW